MCEHNAAQQRQRECTHDSAHCEQCTSDLRVNATSLDEVADSSSSAATAENAFDFPECSPILQGHLGWRTGIGGRSAGEG